MPWAGEPYAEAFVYVDRVVRKTRCTSALPSLLLNRHRNEAVVGAHRHRASDVGPGNMVT